MNYEIRIPTTREERRLDDELMAYNLQKVPPTQEEPFVKICRCAKGPRGELLGGVLACGVLWNVLHIQTVWVREDCRRTGIASALLREVEEEAKQQGCGIAQLDTYDFQAKGFYEKCGYWVFGELKGAPAGHSHYYMYKILESGD